MFRKAFSFGGLLLLAGAAVLVTPGLGQARGGGGHAGGGFHGGGHFGGYRGGFSRGGFHGHSYGHYGNGHYYGGYAGYGGYGGYPFYGVNTYNPYAYGGWGVTKESGYDGSYGDGTPSYSYGDSSLTPPAAGYQSYYPPAATDNSARVTVKVPANARVSFGGTPTTTAGSVREYQSPPLTPGRPYTYEVQASWNENGKEVTQTQQVEVTSGAHVSAAFPIPPAQKR